MWYTFADPVFVNGPEVAFPVEGDGDDSPRDSRLPHLSVAPMQGQLAPGGFVDVTATFQALPVDSCVKGQYEANVTAVISYTQPSGQSRNPAQTVSALIVASTRLPEVMVVEPEVDLGLSAVDRTVKRKITVKNLCNSPAKWTLHQPEWSLVQDVGTPVYNVGRGVTIGFSPASGVLPAHGSVEVNLTCKVRLLCCGSSLRLSDLCCVDAVPFPFPCGVCPGGFQATAHP